MSTHRCMIVGLKYVGASDGVPRRISVGDSVALRLEDDLVSAYHNGQKVGHLSPNKLRLWNSLRPSARRRAKVVGEILDEEGSIAALDVEIAVPTGPAKRPAKTAPPAVPEASARARFVRAGIGFAVLLFTVMTHPDSTGPDQGAKVASAFVPSAGAAGEKAEMVEPPEAIKALAAEVQGISESTEGEIRRKVQLAVAHRAMEKNRRQAAVLEQFRQAEVERAKALEAQLKEAQAAAAEQQKQVAALQQQAREASAKLEAENRKLEGDIETLKRNLEEKRLAEESARQAEREVALRELNALELLQHRNRMAAWTLTSRVAQIKTALKEKIEEERSAKEEERATVEALRNKIAQRVARDEERTPRETVEKPAKRAAQSVIVQPRKKANFSRYSLEAEELDLGPTR
ncbi:MAG TPA: hypothetical protein VIB38_12930 [Aestuariivirgaceae bacterium]